MIKGLLLAGMGIALSFLGGQKTSLESFPLVNWPTAKVFNVPSDPDPQVAQLIENYLTRLTQLGYDRHRQGVWLQTEWAALGENQAYLPLSAASLTKIATSLAALETWNTDYRFITEIYTTGTLENGVLRGDLLIRGGHDPFFVWEEAIALGNALNQLGIRQVKGNLIIVGNFAMNFQENNQKSAEAVKVALDSRKWTPLVEKAYGNLPLSTPRPLLSIAGQLQVSSVLPSEAQLRLSHQSLTLAEILKQMNIYSNNAMAEILGQAVGGAKVVAQTAARAGKFSPDEIQLINGSGLGVENRISPHAAAKMLIALEEKLEDNPFSVADLFPVAGRDRTGTMQWRAIPEGVAIKTGTLNQVSALAGLIPTEERGYVWFTLINSGSGIERFRAEQDRFLQQIGNHWHIIPSNIIDTSISEVFLGDPTRNQLPVH